MASEPAPILRLYLQGWLVNDFCSIIVPVHNAEATLSKHIAHLVEVLPDLAARFEIVVVDDGSTDHTVEIARDLACTYPQLRLIRHPDHRGQTAALKTGSQWAQGRTIVLPHFGSSFSLNHHPRTPQLSSSPTEHARADEAHATPPSARYASMFLRHLRNLTLGE
jgi:hypothetical protein